MLVFVYDGTFDGLLSALFDAYAQKRFPEALYKEGELPPLLAAGSHFVVTDAAKFDRVYRGLLRKLSQNAFKGLLCAWLSEIPGIELSLFRYMRKVFDAPQPIETDLADVDIAAVFHASRKVVGEAHALAGFARFEKTKDEIYFSALSPRHDVLSLLLPHFSARFSGQTWAVYDVGRDYGIISEQGAFSQFSVGEAVRLQLESLGTLPDDELAENERDIQLLWKKYFSASAIVERNNPKLQRRNMPKRYWIHIIEKQ